MAFCAWCGSPVAGVSYAACPRCGNPTNGSQRVAQGGSSAGKSAGIVVGILVGGLVLVAVIGILAAIAIPNFMTALQRSRQKRAMADLRAMAQAVEAYNADEHRYPDDYDLTRAVMPKYTKDLPWKDPWEQTYRYQCWPAGACKHYAVGSPGADQKFERYMMQEYTTEKRTVDFDDDIVLRDGKFLQYPDAMRVD